MAIAATIFPCAPKIGADTAADSGNISPTLTDSRVLRMLSNSARSALRVAIVRSVRASSFVVRKYYSWNSGSENANSTRPAAVQYNGRTAPTGTE